MDEETAACRPSNFPELREAYLAVNKKRETYAKQFNAMKPNNKQHPKYIEDREERAFSYWRWTFEKVMARSAEQLRNQELFKSADF